MLSQIFFMENLLDLDRENRTVLCYETVCYGSNPYSILFPIGVVEN